MKFYASALLSLSLLSSTYAFRDQSQKKRRRLPSEPVEQICTVDHDLAQSPVEMHIDVAAFPREGQGLFKITMHDQPYAPAGGSISTFGWCIDYDRLIWTSTFKMDVFSAFDADIHSDAVDKPAMLPNLAWMVNNVNVGDSWPASGNCPGGPVGWLELQGAVWKLIDHKDGTGTWYERNREDCISEQIAQQARDEGMFYEPDCTDPHEQVPLVLIVDKDDNTNEITNQVIISETNIHTIEGMCSCRDMTDAPTTPPTDAPTDLPTPAPTDSPTGSPRNFPAPPRETQKPSPTASPKGSGSGDPHFKTWTGEKYDYHGECDLVLVDNPAFDNGRGLRIHIRTTRVHYFSFIEKVALQIGNEVLEFDNDVENFLINGTKVEANRKHHKTMFAGYVVRRDKKAISVRLNEHTKTKIDFHTRKNGFPAVIVDAGKDAGEVFEGSLGMLGEWKTGRKLARDGQTVIELGEDKDATEFALEWQVRDTDPILFKESRAPQYPATCIPPKKMLTGRLGMSLAQKEAEEACSHWKEDKEDCIFDVIATRDVLVAQEGHIVHIE